jgi:hypothetical protein
LDLTDVTFAANDSRRLGRSAQLPAHHHVTSRDGLQRSRHFAANRAVMCKPPRLTATARRLGRPLNLLDP